MDDHVDIMMLMIASTQINSARCSHHIVGEDTTARRVSKENQTM